MTPQDFYRTLEKDGFLLSSKQKEQFDTYFKLLVEWNTKINLTAITEKMKFTSSIFMIPSLLFYRAF